MERQINAINNIYLNRGEVCLIVDALELIQQQQPEAPLPTDLIEKLIAKGNMRRKDNDK